MGRGATDVLDGRAACAAGRAASVSAVVTEGAVEVLPGGDVCSEIESNRGARGDPRLRGRAEHVESGRYRVQWFHCKAISAIYLRICSFNLDDFIGARLNLQIIMHANGFN